MLALPHAFLSGTSRLQLALLCAGSARAWRAEGAPLNP